MRYLAMLVFALAVLGPASARVPGIGPASAADVLPPVTTVAHWQTPQVLRLLEWLDHAPGDGLAPIADLAAPVRAAMAAGNADSVDRTATAASIALLEGHRNGCCGHARRGGWLIAGDDFPPAADTVAAAVAEGSRAAIDRLFDSARPTHPQFLALRNILKDETRASRQALLVRNMDRWRWMPRHMSGRYLIVNAAAAEVTLWDGDTQIGRWRTVVGRTRSPTPIFSTIVTGVIINPYWEIPESIVRESVGALMRNSPTVAARRGYVIENGRYRQRPGPGNALGRMKLVMPNPYSIYLHDTPAQGLFASGTRAASHGCVRVADALDFASRLLEPRGDWTGASTNAAVASGRTQLVTLAQPVPVFIAYFTAETNTDGSLRILPDVYRRD